MILNPQITRWEPRRAPRRDTNSLLVVLFFNAALMVWLRFAVATPEIHRWVSNIGQALGPFLMVVWIVAESVRLRRRPGASSIALCLTILGYAAGQSVWTYYDSVLAVKPPQPSLSDVIYFLAYLSLLTGVFLLPTRRIARTIRARVFLDGFIVLTALVTFSWFFLLGPIVLNGSAPPLEKVIAAAYPLLDLVSVFCVILLAMQDGLDQQSGGLPTASLRLFCLGLGVVIVTNSVYSFQLIHSAYVTGTLVDAGWPLGYMLLGLGVHAMIVAGPRSLAPAATVVPARVRPVSWTAMLPYVLIPMVGALILFTSYVDSGMRLRVGCYVGAGLLVVLVLLRQAVAMLSLVGELKDRIVQLEAARGALARQAERDGLTGLFNHRTIYARLETALGANPNAPLAVILLDMDGFKAINDTYGHPTGDQVLQHIAQILQASETPEMVAGRCGGDEFMVVVPGADARAASALARDFQRKLTENPFVGPNDARLPVQLCFGIAAVPGGGAGTTDRSCATLVAAADSALYDAKNNASDDGFAGEGLRLVGPDDESGQSMFTVLNGLVTAIDNKDHYTRRHSEDVTRYALLLVQELGLSRETYNAMRIAGLLHDVGKIGIPNQILRKPGKLTDDEYEVMKSHVTLSALIIHGLPRLHDILDGVAHHHERWDGRGYPNGLTGENTPLLGRIMAVADAFSAMTLDRPYRAGMPFEKALAEIERGAGTQFDPELARLFVTIQRRKATTAGQTAIKSGA